VFLITHDLDTLYAICDRVAVLADRKVIAVGTIPELLALDHEWIQEYFRGPAAGRPCRRRAADCASRHRRRLDPHVAATGGTPLNGNAFQPDHRRQRGARPPGRAGVLPVWLSQPNREGRKSYDILFTQSVGGLTKGAQVTYSGVPVGQVDLVELDRRNPEVIRVQVTIADTVPVLAATRESVAQNNADGTTASLSQVGFTGPIQVELNTPRSLAAGQRQALVTPGPYGNPLIPTKPGGFAAILNNAPEVLDQFRQLAERLTDFFSPRNQESIALILENVQDLTKSLGERGPEIAATLAEARTTMRQAGTAIERFGKLANTTDA
jgi:hypothetical protein